MPDLKAMNRAIKTHVAWHKKEGEKIREKGVLASGKVSELLSQLTLLKTGEQNDT